VHRSDGHPPGLGASMVRNISSRTASQLFRLCAGQRCIEYPAALRRLLIYDDAGQLGNSIGPTWDVISTAQRCPSLTSKYNAMLAAAGMEKFDAVALFGR
jgi:hypothetical protein